MFTYYLDSIKNIVKIENSINEEINETIIDLWNHHIEGQKIFQESWLTATASPATHLKIVAEWTEHYLRKTERLSTVLLKTTKQHIVDFQILANEEITNLKRDVPFEMIGNLETFQQSIETVSKTEQIAIDAVNRRLKKTNQTVREQINGLKNDSGHKI